MRIVYKGLSKCPLTDGRINIVILLLALVDVVDVVVVLADLPGHLAALLGLGQTSTASSPSQSLARHLEAIV